MKLFSKKRKELQKKNKAMNTLLVKWIFIAPSSFYGMSFSGRDNTTQSVSIGIGEQKTKTASNSEKREKETAAIWYTLYECVIQKKNTSI